MFPRGFQIDKENSPREAQIMQRRTKIGIATGPVVPACKPPTRGKQGTAVPGRGNRPEFA
jgi:hypothetical protein